MKSPWYVYKGSHEYALSFAEIWTLEFIGLHPYIRLPCVGLHEVSERWPNSRF